MIWHKTLTFDEFEPNKIILLITVTEEKSNNL